MASKTRSDLAAKMEAQRAAGGGIQANAHPEYAEGPKLGNPITQIGGAIKAVGRFLNPKPKPIGNSSVDRHAQRAYDYAQSEKKRKP